MLIMVITWRVARATYGVVCVVPAERVPISAVTVGFRIRFRLGKEVEQPSAHRARCVLPRRFIQTGMGG